MYTALIVFVLLVTGIAVGFIAGALATHIVKLQAEGDVTVRKYDTIAKLRRNLTEYIEEALTDDTVPDPQYHAVYESKQQAIRIVEKTL